MFGIIPECCSALSRNRVRLAQIPQSVAAVSKRLGHTSTAVTLNTYGHWLPEQDRDAADIIGRLLD